MNGMVTGGAITVRALHFFSQLVYLDLPPGIKNDVGGLASYYTGTAAGKLRMSGRFGSIPREYSEWGRFLALDAAFFAGWRIEDVMDDNSAGGTGLYACSYIAPGGERILAFRGSEQLGSKEHKNDYTSDFALAYMVETPQQAMAKTYLEHFPWAKAAPFGITGHSLGGSLAAYTAITMLQRDMGKLMLCTCFNAPGFCGEFLELHKTGILQATGKTLVYENKYDPVSSMLRHAFRPITASSRFIPEPEGLINLPELFYPHSNFMFATNADGVPITEPHYGKSAFCGSVKELTGLILLLPVKLREDIANHLLDAIYGGGEFHSGKVIHGIVQKLEKASFHAAAETLCGLAKAAGGLVTGHPPYCGPIRLTESGARDELPMHCALAAIFGSLEAQVMMKTL